MGGGTTARLGMAAPTVMDAGRPLRRHAGIGSDDHFSLTERRVEVPLHIDQDQLLEQLPIRLRQERHLVDAGEIEVEHVGGRGVRRKEDCRNQA